MNYINDVFWHFGTPLFFVVLALSMWGLFGYDTPMNTPFVWAWRHLAIPILGIGWLYGLLQRKYFLRDRRVLKGHFWFSLIVCPPIILLFCGGITSLVNGSFPTTDTVTYRGSITKLYASGGRHKECQIVLTDHVAGELTLGVSPSEYSTLVIGQPYTRELRVGLLGIPFRIMRERP
jgi:hypothetical protein